MAVDNIAKSSEYQPFEFLIKFSTQDLLMLITLCRIAQLTGQIYNTKIGFVKRSMQFFLQQEMSYPRNLLRVK